MPATEAIALRAIEPATATTVIEPLAPAAGGEWDAYVDAHPAATLYHLRAWQEVGQRAYSLPAPYLVARSGAGGPIRGALPLFLVRRPLGGYVTTGLFGAYGAVLADHPDIGRALVERARAIAREERARFLVIKSEGEEPSARGLDRRDFSVVAKLPLEPDPETQWNGFKKEIRKAVRKAESAGLAVHVGADQLPAYYDVLAEAMLVKGTPIYGYPFMQALVDALGDRAEVMTLWKDGRAVSAALYVFYRDTVYLPFSASLPDTFEMRPNNLLFWEIIKRACARGMKVLDLGRSPRDSSLLTFKLRWGAQVIDQPWYIDTLRGEPPRFDTSAPSVKRLVELWKRVPRPVADRLGPAICRRFLV
jgi:FemAB-related protein (PEP-CTERM system-associated)